MRSKLEARVAEKFDACGIIWRYEFQKFDMDTSTNDLRSGNQKSGRYQTPHVDVLSNVMNQSYRFSDGLVEFSFHLVDGNLNVTDLRLGRKAILFEHQITSVRRERDQALAERDRALAHADALHASLIEAKADLAEVIRQLKKV